MIRSFVKLLQPAIILGVVMVSEQASAAYTCSNPAICIAVCGARTCGAIASNDRDMRSLQSYSPTLASGPGASARKPYTCFNPAICIAVCGKKTC